MGTQARTPAARRTAYLHGLADTAIAEQDRAAALLTAQEAAKEAQTRERLRLGNAVIKHRAARLEAVGRCEAAAKAFTGATAEVLAAAALEREAMADLSGAHADILADVSILRRLSRYLSHELRQLTGPTASRFGEIRLCNFFRSSLSWEAAERRTASTLPGHEGNGAADDKPVNRGDES